MILEYINKKYADGICLKDIKIKEQQLEIICTFGAKELKFVFDDYCSFFVRKEVSASIDIDTNVNGTIINQRSQSWFTKMIDDTTDFLYNSIEHYQIVCEFEVIDIASYTSLEFYE